MRSRPVAACAAVLALAVAVALAGCSGGGLGEAASVAVEPTVARAPAPPVSVDALDGGEPVTLASHLGAPVILNFWASWCEPCMREMPALIEFSKRHDGLDVVGIAINDRPADARAFAKRLGIPFELGVDQAGSTAAAFGATGLPVTVIIDHEGLIADTHFGEITTQQLDDYAEQLGL